MWGFLFLSLSLAWQTSDLMKSAQQALEMSSISTNSATFANSVACQPEEQEQPPSSVFSDKETLNNMQKQDTTQNSSFHVSRKPVLQQGAQQFILDGDSLAQERSGTTGGTLVGIGQMDDSPQHQLSLLPPDEVAQLEQAVRQLQAKGFCNIQLHSADSLAKKQQQQQLQRKQIQQQQLHQQQMQQQQQALENLQHHLFHPQVPMHCGGEQQGSPPGMVENGNALFQQPAPQQQPQAVMYHQAKDLMSIQSGFLQQATSHTSAPLFHSSNTLAEAQPPQEALFHTQKTSPTQEQVQASLFQSTMNVLDGSNMSAEAQHSATSMFLSQNTLPGQLAGNGTQSQQLAFLNSVQTSGLEPQSVFQATSQMSSIQQSTPMEQQSPQQTSQTPPGSMFQSIQQSPNNKHQAGLLYNTLSSGMSPEQPPSSLMFTGQPPMPSMNTTSLISPEQQNPSLSYPQNGMIAVRQEVPSEPMSFQDRSSVVDNRSASKQQLFQEQQPMQLAPSSGTGPQPSVNLFIAQADMPRMPHASQHASQEVLYAPQSNVPGLQTTTSSPVQQPGSLFQTTVNGSLSQPNQNQQPNIFLYELQNGKHDIHVQCVELLVRAWWKYYVAPTEHKNSTPGHLTLKHIRQKRATAARSQNASQRLSAFLLRMYTQ